MGRITVMGTGFTEKQLTLEALEPLQSGARVMLHTGRCGAAECLSGRELHSRRWMSCTSGGGL